MLHRRSPLNAPKRNPIAYPPTCTVIPIMGSDDRVSAIYSSTGASAWSLISLSGFCGRKAQWTLTQRPCYQRGSPCQDPAGNRITQRPPDHGNETQTAVVWSYLPFITSGQKHLATHSERGKKTGQTEEEVGRHHQRMDRPGVRQVPEGSGEQGKMEEIGCKIICGAPKTLAVKG